MNYHTSKKMKGTKKGEIVIYVLALMLVTAGYFNYVQFNNTQDTTSELTKNEENKQNETKEEYSSIGDAVFVNSDFKEENKENNVENKENDEIKNKQKEEQNTTETSEKQDNNKSMEENIKNDTENKEEKSEKVKEEEAKNEEKVQETASKQIDSSKEYFANSKLERDRMYAEMITSYQNILNNEKISEVQKSIATEEIKNINNAKNAIMICENLIQTKGFEDCVIFINGDSVNIVVEIENGLTQINVAKIQNIISREIGTSIENIHITEN